MAEESWTAVDEYVSGLLALSIGAKSILEFGTLGGYSTIWLGRALPADGRLITLEAEPGNAEVAGRNIARAGLGDLVDLRIGPALETLPRLEGDNVVRFGALADPDSDDPTIPAQRRLHEMLADDPRVESTTIQTVGVKGHDGFNLALVRG